LPDRDPQVGGEGGDVGLRRHTGNFSAFRQVNCTGYLCIM
jgi:hypothetical protein